MTTLRRVPYVFALLLGGGVLLSSSRVHAIPEKDVRTLVSQAEALEKLPIPNWEEARKIYEALLGQNDPGLRIRERYQNAQRRCWQGRRHQDSSYQKEVLSVDYGQALRICTIINNTLLDGSYDKKKVDPAKLFRKGLEELDAAFADIRFVQQHVPPGRHGDVAAFRAALRKAASELRGLSRKDAVKRIAEIALVAESELDINPTVVVMEFGCGACYAIDDYTVYLTPNQLRDLAQSLSQSEAQSVGLFLKIQDNKIIVRDVAMDSQAAERIGAGDEIVSIDNQPVVNLNLDMIKKLLEGPVGSTVAVEVRSPGDDLTRTERLTRQATIASVLWYQRESTPFWHMKITSFADTTPQHIDRAMQDMTRAGAKGLILDLRQNNGGIVDSAIETARRFLSTGIIASSVNQDTRENQVYHARNPKAFTIPLVILVDNDTASAAEVLAGALKDNNRALLVGQTTFGKGCTQRVLKLPASPGGVPTGGMRLTVARFFSPKGIPYSGRGVVPHVFIDDRVMVSQSNMMADPSLERATDELTRMLAMSK